MTGFRYPRRAIQHWPIQTKRKLAAKDSPKTLDPASNSPLIEVSTFISVPAFAFKDRDIIEIHASDRPADVLARFPRRIVFIGGGPPIYAAYAPFIRHWDINRSRLAGRGRPLGLAAALPWSPAETATPP